MGQDFGKASHRAFVTKGCDKIQWFAEQKDGKPH